MGFVTDWSWVSWMWVPMVLWWAFVALAIIALVQWIGSGTRGHGKSAREILDERYARGEISKAEFEVKRRDISA